MRIIFAKLRDVLQRPGKDWARIGFRVAFRELCDLKPDREP